MNLFHDELIFEEDVFDTVDKSAKIGNYYVILFHLHKLYQTMLIL